MSNRETSDKPDTGPVYGPWVTILWGILVALVFLLTAIITTIVILVSGLAGDNIRGIDIKTNGLIISLMSITTSLVCIILIIYLIRLKKGASVRAYLAFNPVSLRMLGFWLIAFLIWVFISDVGTDLLNCSSGQELMMKAYQTAGSVPLLWLGICLFAPIFEEICFRGFLFAGIEKSRLGGWGAVIATAFIWASVHAHYQLCDMIIILISGFLIGYARLRSKSLYPPIVMHIAINIMATLQASGQI